jgi:hypothetical protein
MSTAALAMPPRVPSFSQRQRQDRRSWWLVYALCLFISLIVAALAAKTSPQPFTLAFLILAIGMVVAIVRPLAGLYLTIFFAILGDPVTAPWYPFTKQFSSPESILYISNSVILSPLEVFLGALLIGWLLQMASTRQWTLVRGDLLKPVLVFTGFVMFGLANGLAHGGTTHIALAESRTLFYLPIVYIVVTNLVRRSEQYNRLYWLVMVATSINGVIALFHLHYMSPADRRAMESLVAHGETLAVNAMIMLITAAWLLRDRSRAKRLLLPILAIPPVWAYLVSERRAAFVALIAGLILLTVMLFWTNRGRFWRVASTAGVILLLYCAAFWNSSGTLGFPAQAIKSAVAPSQLNARDQGSDIYRLIETSDIRYTIRTNPITGIGFGQKFLKPIPLPAISAFQLSDYITHNSILWVWMKVGVFGFMSMVVLFGATITTGARSLVRVREGPFAVLTFTSLAFVVMYAVFAYVDIAWDRQNMVLLGLAMAQIGSAARMEKQLASRPESTDPVLTLEQA